MMQEKKPDQAGAGDASVNQDEASKARKPGELNAEELAKVSGGIIAGGAFGWVGTNSPKWSGPTPILFGKK